MDYSKWDSLEVSDDEDNRPVTAPRVTKLTTPGTVTVGPGGVVQIVQQQPQKNLEVAGEKTLDYAKWDRIAKDLDDGVEEEPKEYFEKEWYDKSVEIARQKESFEQNVQISESTSTTASGEENLVEKGSQESGYLWSQDKEQVVIRVLIPKSVPAKAVAVNLDKDGRLRVQVNRVDTMNRMLRHDVWGAVHQTAKELDITEEMEEERELCWELKDVPEKFHQHDQSGELLSRCVMITVWKYFPRLVRTVWWDRAFSDGEETPIDIAQFNSSNAFHHALIEAEESFRRKAGER